MKVKSLLLASLFGSMLLTSCGEFNGLIADGKLHDLKDGLYVETSVQSVYNNERTSKKLLWGEEKEVWIENNEKWTAKYRKYTEVTNLNIYQFSVKIEFSYDEYDEETKEVTHLEGYHFVQLSGVVGDVHYSEYKSPEEPVMKHVDTKMRARVNEEADPIETVNAWGNPLILYELEDINLLEYFSMETYKKGMATLEQEIYAYEMQDKGDFYTSDFEDPRYGLYYKTVDEEEKEIYLQFYIDDDDEDYQEKRDELVKLDSKKLVEQSKQVVPNYYLSGRPN